MAGKMLEPDSNTREIHLNSLAETMQGKSSYLENVNCFETNGQVNYGDCDVLPNNNIRAKTASSQCYSDGECSKSDENASPLGKNASHSFSTGESTSDGGPQESDIHSLRNSGEKVSSYSNY